MECKDNREVKNSHDVHEGLEMITTIVVQTEQVYTLICRICSFALRINIPNQQFFSHVGTDFIDN